MRGPFRNLAAVCKSSQCKADPPGSPKTDATTLDCETLGEPMHKPPAPFAGAWIQSIDCRLPNLADESHTYFLVVERKDGLYLSEAIARVGGNEADKKSSRVFPQRCAASDV